MNEQEQLEAQYRANAAKGDIPKDDPLPRMIIVCTGITLFLLMVIMGFLFVDFIIGPSRQNVRPPAEVVQPEARRMSGVAERA